MKPQEIIRLREDMGITQGQLAALIGTHQVVISRWETGKARPRGMGQKALERLQAATPHKKK